MTELSLRFTSNETDEHSPIAVSLLRLDTGANTAPVPFTPPLDDPELAEICWYLEIYGAWATEPDKERAQRIGS